MQRLLTTSRPQTRQGEISAKFGTLAQSTPLFDTATLRQIEIQALGAVKPGETSLMQRAGHALYRLAIARYPHTQRIWVVAGAGNNGGDAIVAATWLKRSGRKVVLTWLGSPERMSSNTAQAIAAANDADVPISLGHSAAPNADLIIDGLLGIGFDGARPLSDMVLKHIDKINTHEASVLAVDLPSGLVADTGMAPGACVRADTTLTFLRAKRGLFTADGRAFAGDIWLDDLAIGTYPQIPAARLYAGDLTQHTARAANTHKGSFGDVVVIGGSSGMTGATILAGKSALHAGAGRVYISLLSPSQPGILGDTEQPELMFRALSTIAAEQFTIACGCGGGNDIASVLPDVFGKCPRLVLDADALNAVANNPALGQQLAARVQAGLSTIITPHPLEAARLLGSTSAQVQANRPAAAQTLAERFNCICVLKGSGTIVAAPEQIPFINSSGNAALATAGTGDVLAGWIAGRWSANRNMNTHENLQLLVAQSVWEHGHAADLWLSSGHRGPLPAATLANMLLTD